MPTLPTQSFSTIVNNTVVGIQGRSNKLINFQTGSTLRAIVEGFAGIYLWFQGLVLELLTACRLSTASGLDVDTFVADFMPIIPGSQTLALPNGSPRLGAQSSTGQVTFARFTAAPSTVFIPAALSAALNSLGVPTIINAGPNNAAQVQTTDLSQTFVVTADTTNAAYSATLGGYTLAANIASIILPVQALIPGSGGNVQAGAISLFSTPLVGLDTVTNIAAYTNGTNQESDSALKVRFATYILGLSRGDYYGLSAAILGVAPSVQWTLTESYDYVGTFHAGTFFVVADDGSGAPPMTFLQSVSNAVSSVRPLGCQFHVFAPVIITANVSLQIFTAKNYNHNTVVAQVSATIATNINSLGLGNSLPWSLLISWAYSVPGVTAVDNVVLNGAQGDAASINAFRIPTDGSNVQMGIYTIKAGTVNVS